MVTVKVDGLGLLVKIRTNKSSENRKHGVSAPFRISCYVLVIPCNFVSMALWPIHHKCGHRHKIAWEK